MKIYRYLSIVLLGALLLSACSTISDSSGAATPRPDEPVSSSTPTVEPGGEQPSSGDGIVGENASVEEIQLMILESFPVQVNALVRGSLPDGCTTLKEITTTREGETFTVTILTQRSLGAVCNEALVPFEQAVSLDVFGLPAGTYTVKAYDQTATFTLTVDNIFQAQATCPDAGADQRLFSRQVEASGAAFCFLYPQDFEILGSGAPDFFQLIEPQCGEEPEPIRASLTIATLDPAGRSLEQHVQEKMDAYPDMTFTPEEITLEGAPAILVDQFPGRLLHRMVYAEHNGLTYELAFAPVEEVFPEATADMERLYNSVVSSWTFLE